MNRYVGMIRAHAEAAKSMGVVAENKERTIHPYLILFVGVIAASFAAIFIRLCDAPSLVIAAYRLSLASVILSPVVLLRSFDEFKSLSKGEFRLTSLAGLFLALHFALWITSLEYTSVASSVVLVTTNPIFVGIASHLLLKERVSKRMSVGIAISVIGGMVIGLGDWGAEANSLFGDLLALFGAILMSGYLLAGRRLRQRLSLSSYIFLAYTTSAIILIALCLITRQSFFGYSRQTYLFFLLLALVPQLIGHSSINWALKHLSSSMVAVALLGEPIGATILAYFILGEAPTLVRALGGLSVLAGIYLSSREERESLMGA